MRVYFDHNATTPLRPEVRDLFVATLDRLGGNPSSLHQGGREARLLLDRARERVAASLCVLEEEIVFTSGGTESNNLALVGALAGRADRSRGLVTSAIEHASVLEPAEFLARQGWSVTTLAVDSAGLVEPQLIAEAARGSLLVSWMAANNEVGSALDLDALGTALRRLDGDRPLFHSDAVQALGRLPLDLGRAGLDLASFSCHKLGGPVGVGVLFVRRGVQLEPLARGGGQEHALRPGTENVAAIVAGARAIELAVEEQVSFAGRLRELQDLLWSGVQAALPRARLIGPPLGSARRLPGTLSILVPHVDGKVLTTRLDLAGLAISAGSACASGSLEPSHVVTALGFDRDDARSAMRLSLGRSTREEDVHRAVEILRTTLG